MVLKLYKKEYIMANEEENMQAFINEVSILSSCDHKNIIKLINYGRAGTIQFTNGSVL